MIEDNDASFPTNTINEDAVMSANPQNPTYVI